MQTYNYTVTSSYSLYVLNINTSLSWLYAGDKISGNRLVTPHLCCWMKCFSLCVKSRLLFSVLLSTPKFFPLRGRIYRLALPPSCGSAAEVPRVYSMWISVWLVSVFVFHIIPQKIPTWFKGKYAIWQDETKWVLASWLKENNSSKTAAIRFF